MIYASRMNRIPDAGESVLIRDETAGRVLLPSLSIPFLVPTAAFSGDVLYASSQVAITCTEYSGIVELLASPAPNTVNAAVVGTVAIAAPSVAHLAIEADVIRAAVPTGPIWLLLRVTADDPMLGVNYRAEVALH